MQETQLPWLTLLPPGLALAGTWTQEPELGTEPMYPDAGIQRGQTPALRNLTLGLYFLLHGITLDEICRLFSPMSGQKANMKFVGHSTPVVATQLCRAKSGHGETTASQKEESGHPNNSVDKADSGPWLGHAGSLEAPPCLSHGYQVPKDMHHHLSLPGHASTGDGGQE